MSTGVCVRASMCAEWEDQGTVLDVYRYICLSVCLSVCVQVCVCACVYACSVASLPRLCFQLKYFSSSGLFLLNLS